MSDPLVQKIITESKAAIELWDLKLGHLIVINTPENFSPERTEQLIAGIGEWWITKAPYFRGAKLMILQPGVTLGVHTDASLIQLGYTRLKDVGATVDDSLAPAADYLEERGFNVAAAALRHIAGVS